MPFLNVCLPFYHKVEIKNMSKVYHTIQITLSQEEKIEEQHTTLKEKESALKVQVTYLLLAWLLSAWL